MFGCEAKIKMGSFVHFVSRPRCHPDVGYLPVKSVICVARCQLPLIKQAVEVQSPALLQANATMTNGRRHQYVQISSCCSGGSNLLT